MSTRIDGNKIIIPVEIALEDKKEWQEIVKQAEELRKSPLQSQDPEFDQVLNDAIKDSVDDAVGDIADQKFSKEVFGRSEGGIDNLIAYAQNPKGTILNFITQLVPQISALLLIPVIIEKIIHFLTAPGGPLDIRFKRDIPKEVLGFMSRQEQQQRRLGYKQVIITSTDGFRSLNGASAGNTLDQVRRFGVAKIGLQEKAQGWRP